MSSVSDRSLHCIASAPLSPAGQRLLAQLEKDDPLLLTGKAVALAAASHPSITDWVATGAVIHALEEDLLAHGITDLHPSVITTDYVGWVSLTENYRTQVLWR
ncbi:DsrH/TusB family sulfur metabolism protein [Congregibacter brevis]|uniref:DsrH/TusB family sulfur metabolism protein n=1 Tax=Congregibacter brevis TaxID=3081201 RepID=A0ABZ0I8G8_9GAMM|nr:DsrH/TusB family sulfur metabolism protein [Congregibacter sp. IMCC45268]